MWKNILKSRVKITFYVIILVINFKGLNNNRCYQRYVDKSLTTTHPHTPSLTSDLQQFCGLTSLTMASLTLSTECH